jgi:hypothetical protein
MPPTRSGETTARPIQLSAAALYNLELFGLPPGLDEHLIADAGQDEEHNPGK